MSSTLPCYISYAATLWVNRVLSNLSVLMALQGDRDNVKTMGLTFRPGQD